MLSASEAKKCIFEYTQHIDFELTISRHAKRRMWQRGINETDVLYVLEHGYIETVDSSDSQETLCKCMICGYTPRSGSRKVCLVAVVGESKPSVQLITAMWEDLP